MFCKLSPISSFFLTLIKFSAPALVAVGDDYEDVRFNSTIFGSSPYIGAPSLEIDEHWKALIHDGAISISYSELLKIGASNNSVLLPAARGGGYMAWLEVYHQLHCLHTLWQNTWPTYYNATQLESEDKDSIYRKHIDHCADNLRQKLMCDADVGIITYDWLEKHKSPVPNFNTVHRCRDLKRVWSWHADRRVLRSGSDELVKMPNSVVLDHLP
ncbi:uncharacterized protein LY89DRAFT_768471 [Mollisia scopiformis]|uniref:Uncharacterized protein n=1 Tax=Mollisia scopiformis TaxID=149040 RepID=A0A194XQ37_MOLSC|nr:uncharacterized protein LY89DRAFT_768471 [Mollisia scopiformis]KUJ22169.1 hypothetical protein LY89DRAFT_768471 [Mollisia scopiformis]